MEHLKTIIDYILHLNVHLAELASNYGPWIYLILFLIIFCETGLVVTPFLPGDSLLFAIGALSASGGLDLTTVMLLLIAAAVLGDNTNYWLGYWLGPRVFQRKDSRLLNRQHLERTHAFYETYGGKALVFARFMPIVRTFAPFVAGIGRMTYGKFLAFSVFGGVVWICSLSLLGYQFGQHPFVKKNFSVVILAIIVISLLPAVIEFIRHKKNSRPAQTPVDRGH